MAFPYKPAEIRSVPLIASSFIPTGKTPLSISFCISLINFNSVGEDFLMYEFFPDFLFPVN